LFASVSGGGIVYLIDLDGKVIHTWQMPYAPGQYGYLTDRGTLFYNGKTAEDSGRFIEVTTGRELVWEFVNPYFEGPSNARNNRVFRAYRYGAEEVARVRATGSAL
jgi:hypothetical protein